MKPLVIFGASTLARLAHYYATREMAVEAAGFVVDDAYANGASFQSLPVWAWSEFLTRHDPSTVALHVAIGYRDMRARAAAFRMVGAAGYDTINIVSRASYLADDATLGSNNLLMPGVVVESGVSMGANNVVWSNATICHDCRIGDHNFIAANATLGGGVRVGDGNFLGFSSVVLQGRSVGSETMIDAQSLVRHDTLDLHRYHGVPARTVGTIDPALGIRVDEAHWRLS